MKSSYPASHAYRLYAHGEVVSYLQWRHGAGWYLWQQGKSWWRVAEAADPASALDIAAAIVLGPPEPVASSCRSGPYEIHVCGLAPDVVPVAFPETIAVRAGDVSVLSGDFDAAALGRLTRRITVLGGQLLALFEEAAS